MVYKHSYTKLSFGSLYSCMGKRLNDGLLRNYNPVQIVITLRDLQKVFSYVEH